MNILLTFDSQTCWLLILFIEFLSTYEREGEREREREREREMVVDFIH